ncbi:hypothetical protein CZ771_04250 [Actinomycetales bacterium JB111]|nr:hypothetical protein CZ771_04250 [Actinomycetales bacterium JB111]
MTSWTEVGVAAALVVVTGIAAALTGSPVVSALLRRFTMRDTDRDGAADLHFHPRGLDNGGRWIGYLERAAIAASIVTGVPETVAVVLAIKGLGRYPELRSDQRPREGADAVVGDDPAGTPGGHSPIVGLTAERFIIGTLASYLWAASWGLAGLAIRTAIS